MLQLCQHCGTRYEWKKSSSRWLRLTYCTWTCEKAGEGFLIEQLFEVERWPFSELLTELAGRRRW
jgi:hypothetical protein